MVSLQVVSMAVDVFRPDDWHDFFLLVGTGAVTLTGLIFVALTIHLRDITGDVVRRSRALGSLTGLTVVFLQSAAALLPGQSHGLLGLELLLLAVLGLSLFLRGVYQTVTTKPTAPAYNWPRALWGVGLYLVEIAGAAIFVAGQIAGLYVVAVGIAANIFFIVTGAWLLVAGPATKS